MVLVAVPVTLALTLFAYYALGYTLNRITLFALIFSIGILVDDAIVVVENIYRHLRWATKRRRTPRWRAWTRWAIPTILATFTVIAAILPMAFVSGLMGPYMRPIPVGASVAMLASLGVAFIVTPYLALRLLRGHVPAGPAHAQDAGARAGEEASRFGRFYARLMRRSWTGRGGGGRSTAPSWCCSRPRSGSLALKVVHGEDAAVRQQERVPGDPGPARGRHAGDLAPRSGPRSPHTCATVPEVRSTEVYAGTSAPFNFNGLVRHYFLRPRRQRRRRAGEPAAQGGPVSARATRSPWRCGRASTRSRPRLRRERQDRGDPAGPAGALDARRRSLRGRTTARGWSRRGP